MARSSITADKDFTLIQSQDQLGKLIRYRSSNRSRAEIIEDFTGFMPRIEAFAKTNDALLELP